MKISFHLLGMMIALLALDSSACAFARKRDRVSVDTVTPSAAETGDATTIIEGCGNQPIVGHAYCRQVEGDTADKSISLVGPPAQCDRDACVFFKIYDNQGRLAWGDSIPQGQTRVAAPWWKLLGCPGQTPACVFSVGSRGFWAVEMQVFYKDQDGRERQALASGDIVLRVFRQGYVPLDAVEHDPNFVWEWSEGSTVYRMTAGLRAFVGEVSQ